MKKIKLILIVLFYSGYVFSQSDSSNYKAGWGNLDYTTPQSPAFKILGNNPDNILQPTSVKSIALNIGNFYLANGSTIPKNLGVEISPLLLNPKVSLNDYNNMKFLYRMRLSLGTNIVSSGEYNVAEGIRFTIIDKTDLRSDDEFKNALYSSCIDRSVTINLALNEYLKSHPELPAAMKAELPESYKKDTVFKKTIDGLAKKYITHNMINNDSINTLRDIKRQKLWNKTIWEAGAAVMQVSPDSLANNLKTSKIGIWTTYGTHLSANDQLLIGGKFGMNDSISKWNTSASIGVRYYYGSNELRAFVQGEYRYQNNSNGATASVGCVFNITNGLWGQFAMNFICDKNGKITYSPGFNLSFGTPEKKKY